MPWGQCSTQQPQGNVHEDRNHKNCNQAGENLIKDSALKTVQEEVAEIPNSNYRPN